MSIVLYCTLCYLANLATIKYTYIHATQYGTGRNATERRFHRFTRPAAARVHDVGEPAELGGLVEARRALVVRLGLGTDLVRDVVGQRAPVGKRVDEDDAGEVELTKLWVRCVLLQFSFVRERCTSTAITRLTVSSSPFLSRVHTVGY